MAQLKALWSSTWLIFSQQLLVIEFCTIISHRFLDQNNWCGWNLRILFITFTSDWPPWVGSLIDNCGSWCLLYHQLERKDWNSIKLCYFDCGCAIHTGPTFWTLNCREALPGFLGRLPFIPGIYTGSSHVVSIRLKDSSTAAPVFNDLGIWGRLMSSFDHDVCRYCGEFIRHVLLAATCSLTNIWL